MIDAMAKTVVLKAQMCERERRTQRTACYTYLSLLGRTLSYSNPFPSLDAALRWASLRFFRPQGKETLVAAMFRSV